MSEFFRLSADSSDEDDTGLSGSKEDEVVKLRRLGLD